MHVRHATCVYFLLMILVGCGGDSPLAGGESSEQVEDSVSLPEDASCGDSVLYERSSDPGELGPWPVGARTVDVAGLKGEIWYPALVGSEVGQESEVYDIRLQLAPEEGAKITDENNPWHHCDCYRDLPLDEARGPYPVIVFVHGTAAFRHQSLSLMTHWASRGFVVAALDHPGLKLGDMLSFNMNQNLSGDIEELFAALDAQAGDLAFLAGRIDMERVGAAGHSAGGQAVSALGDRASVIIAMAAGGARPGSKLVSTLVLGGMDDGIASFSRVRDGYGSSPGEKRLVGIANAGHLVFSDLCALGAEDGGLLEIAQDAGVSNASFASFLWDGCDEGQIDPVLGNAITAHVTTAVLESELQCRGDIAPDVYGFQARYPEVVEFVHEAN
jgi:hypothetical protein